MSSLRRGSIGLGALIGHLRLDTYRLGPVDVASFYHSKVSAL